MWSGGENSAVDELNLAMFAPVVKSSDVVAYYRRAMTTDHREARANTDQTRHRQASAVVEVKSARMRSLSNIRLFVEDVRRGR